MSRITQAIPAILLLAATISACDIQVGDNGVSVDLAQGRARDEWVRTYTLPPGGRVEIVNANGTIDAEPASGSQVEVRVERTAQGSSDENSRALLQSIRMDEQVTADRIRIEGTLPELPEGTRPAGRRNISLRYHVRVPLGAKAAVSFETSNGAINLDGLDAQVVASTTNGGITGEGLSGAVKATAVNGGIRLDMTKVTGDIEVAITNGGIRIDLPADAKASLDASCVNGGINVDDALQLLATESSRRRVTGSLNGGGRKIVATTVNGGVRITARGDGDSTASDREPPRFR